MIEYSSDYRRKTEFEEMNVFGLENKISFLDPNRTEEIRIRIDPNPKDGFLSIDEFLRVPNLKPEIASLILAHLDTAPKDSKISKNEFLAALKPPVPPVPPTPPTNPPTPPAP